MTANSKSHQSLTPAIVAYGCISAIAGAGIALIFSNEYYKNDSGQIALLILLIIWMIDFIFIIVKSTQFTRLVNVMIDRARIAEMNRKKAQSKRKGFFNR